MYGIALEILLSYFLLRHFGYSLDQALGLKINTRRVTLFILGLIVPLLYYILYKFTVACVTGNPYYYNSVYRLHDFVSALAYIARGVLTEELLFRGAILYLLIIRIGSTRAVLLSSAAFGVYHWFSFQVFGNPAQMLVVFFMTATCGYVFAVAYNRTRSVYLPVALHLGNNIAVSILFSEDRRIGGQMLLKTFETDPVIPPTYIGLPLLLLHFTGFQLLIWWLLMKVKWLRHI